MRYNQPPEGMSAKAISKKLGISETMVYFYLRSAIKKMKENKSLRELFEEVENRDNFDPYIYADCN